MEGTNFLATEAAMHRHRKAATLHSRYPMPWMAARLRAMESRTGSVGDCSKIANYRASKQNLFRRRSTRRRISNAQRLADLEDFINRRY
ncbi:hypothetical protein TELCIR_06684 [Teladorsagia circumcincta]|uniref:Uncharacterized protein n=1 Tax=Teladorsagia circumcincta TaxID=45464 RepID=A0A2G9UMD9_TELCI|nr:hypothetical protein TELCIR_06684 [Teladorsagia circumcincta]